MLNRSRAQRHRDFRVLPSSVRRALRFAAERSLAWTATSNAPADRIDRAYAARRSMLACRSPRCSAPVAHDMTRDALKRFGRKPAKFERSESKLPRHPWREHRTRADKGEEALAAIHRTGR